jgi:RIO kinase 1
MDLPGVFSIMSKKNLPEWWQELDQEHEPPPVKPFRPATHRISKEALESQAELQALLAQRDGAESFDFTYHAARHEEEWLMRSLGAFYEHRWINDVLRQVKGGKEANVYLCTSGSEVKARYLAVKVYRPRKLRNLKNDHLYREGRENLDSDGNVITDDGQLHAMRNKTGYGLELLHTSWLEHEFNTLKLLHAAKADVPTPYACENNALLMGYVGDEQLAAPTLNSVHLKYDEAHYLYRRLLRNVRIMLSCDRVHGDLSAYNILYWEGKITLIDFPQAISPQQNRSAYHIFERDLVRVSEYFARKGVPVQPRRLAAELWTSYGHSLVPDVHPALLDDQDEKDLAYWRSLAR